MHGRDIADRETGRLRLEEIGARCAPSSVAGVEPQMEYQIFAEIDGKSVPHFEPVAALTDDEARDAALALIQSRADILEVTIFRGNKMLAVLDRSAG